MDRKCKICFKDISERGNRSIFCKYHAEKIRKRNKLEANRKWRGRKNPRTFLVGKAKPQLGGYNLVIHKLFTKSDDIEREDAYYEEDEDGNYKITISKERIKEFERKFVTINQVKKPQTWRERLKKRYSFSK